MRCAVPLAALVLVLACSALGVWAVRRETGQNAAAVERSREALAWVVAPTTAPVSSTVPRAVTQAPLAAGTTAAPVVTTAAPVGVTTAPAVTASSPAVTSATTTSAPAVAFEETYALFLMHHNDRYFECVLTSACKLRRLDPSRAVTVLVMREVSGLERRQLGVCATAVVEVGLIEPVGVLYPIAEYRNTYTKLFIFNMLAFRRVVFVDADLVLVQTLVPAITACGDAELCAVLDSMAGPTYFNAGFLIVRPSRKRFEMLLVQMNKKPNRAFPEQDLLNDVFAGNWKTLDRKFNQLHYNDALRWSQQHGIQEKPWIYRNGMPGLYSMWQADRALALGAVKAAGL